LGFQIMVLCRIANFIWLQIFFNCYRSEIKKLGIVYLLYLISLLILEILGQHIFSIHEISKSDSKALIFDLVHGTKVLHIFYLSAPFIFISTFKILCLIVYKSYNKVNDHSKMSLVLPEFLPSKKNSLSIWQLTAG